MPTFGERDARPHPARDRAVRRRRLRQRARIQEERYGNRLIASDLANPDFMRFAESFGAAAERVRSPEELRPALRRGFARRDGPTLIEVPVGAMPSPWEFIFLPKVRGG